MRIGLSFVILLAGSFSGLAQIRDFSDSEMVKRIDSNRDRAMAAVNEGATKRKKKEDLSLRSMYSGKSFGAESNVLGKKTSEVPAFRYDQKYNSTNYRETRSFFGIKNPWFGAKTFDVRKDKEASKDLYDGNKDFQVREAETKTAWQSDKTMNTGNEIVEIRSFEAKGKQQRNLDLTHQKNKDMTIEEVRELLNKNR